MVLLTPKVHIIYLIYWSIISMSGKSINCLTIFVEDKIVFLIFIIEYEM